MSESAPIPGTLVETVLAESPLTVAFRLELAPGESVTLPQYVGLLQTIQNLLAFQANANPLWRVRWGMPGSGQLEANGLTVRVVAIGPAEPAGEVPV